MLLLSAHPFGELVPTGERVALDEETLLAPILPSKVIGIGRNYAEHAREMGCETPERPLLFLKPSTSVIGPGKSISMPRHPGRLRGRAGASSSAGCAARCRSARAFEVILGYTCGNDVTARDWQRADGQWTRAKGGDTFCPLGPWIETELDPDRPRDPHASSTGRYARTARTSQLIHDDPRAHRVRQHRDDAPAGRRHPDRHARRDRAAPGRADRNGRDRGHRHRCRMWRSPDERPSAPGPAPRRRAPSRDPADGPVDAHAVRPGAVG